MPFDGPAGVLMEASDTVDRQAQQPNHANEPTVFFVNVREPLRRFDFFCEIPAIRTVKRLGLPASGNLPVSYVLTGNLPEIHHIVYFLVISKYIGVDTGAKRYN